MPNVILLFKNDWNVLDTGMKLVKLLHYRNTLEMFWFVLFRKVNGV